MGLLTVTLPCLAALLLSVVAMAAVVGSCSTSAHDGGSQANGSANTVVGDRGAPFEVVACGLGPGCLGRPWRRLSSLLRCPRVLHEAGLQNAAKRGHACMGQPCLVGVAAGWTTSTWPSHHLGVQHQGCNLH